MRVDIDAEVVNKNNAPVITEECAGNRVVGNGDSNGIGKIVGKGRSDFGEVNAAPLSEDIGIDEIDAGIESVGENALEYGGGNKGSVVISDFTVNLNLNIRNGLLTKCDDSFTDTFSEIEIW